MSGHSQSRVRAEKVVRKKQLKPNKKYSSEEDAQSDKYNYLYQDKQNDESDGVQIIDDINQR